MAKAKQGVPQGLHTVTPMLTCDDTAKAIAWYTKAFGAEELSRSPDADGNILHAQVRIGNSHFMLHDAMATSIPASSMNERAVSSDHRSGASPPTGA